jgi:hypothetical protein
MELDYQVDRLNTHRAPLNVAPIIILAEDYPEEYENTKWSFRSKKRYIS